MVRPAWGGTAIAMRRPLHIHELGDAGCLEPAGYAADGSALFRCTAPGVYPPGIVLVVEPGRRPMARVRSDVVTA